MGLLTTFQTCSEGRHQTQLLRQGYSLFFCGGPKSTYGENKEIGSLSVVHMFFLRSEIGEVTLGIKLSLKPVIMSQKEGFSFGAQFRAGPCWDSGDLKCCLLYASNQLTKMLWM